MKLCILDGSHKDDPMAQRVQKLLTTLVVNDHVELFTICDLAIAPCTGCFHCWIKSPGICKNRDDNRLIAKTMINSDLVILLTPVTFGGYSASLKGGLDHLIQNISPLFIQIGGETHHKKRYERYPDLAVIGWTENGDDYPKLLFKHLVGRNSLNFNAENTYCELFTPGQPDSDIKTGIKAILQGSAEQVELTPLKKATKVESQGVQTEPKKALLLVGSPRRRRSSSFVLGTYLLSQLQEQSLSCETILLYAKRDPDEEEQLYTAIEQADLVILAFGLYVDSLPAPVIGFLERLAKHREQNISDNSERSTQFVALANCGFPEASHTENALAIAQQFSQETGLVWRGGIGVGGGNGLGKTGLHEEKRTSLPIRNALHLAALALSQGRAIPQEAIDMAAKMPYPALFFRLGAQFFWKRVAANYGASKSLDDRPYTQT